MSDKQIMRHILALLRYFVFSRNKSEYLDGLMLCTTLKDITND